MVEKKSSWMEEKLKLKPEEAKALRDLEELIGSSIPQLDMNKKTPFSPIVGMFGVKIDNEHVIDLRLDGAILLKINPSNLTELLEWSKLTEFLELNGNFSSLQQLRLTRLQLTTLPESIENLTLLKKLDKEAKLVDSLKDETIYFGGPKDLRSRYDGKQTFLILKEGKIHDKFREELTVKCNKEDFNKLEELLVKLGYGVEIRWFRKRRIYRWKGLRLLLGDTKGYGYIVELEKFGKVGKRKTIYKNLENKLKSLGIRITPKGEFSKKFEYYKKNWQKILNYKKQ